MENEELGILSDKKEKTRKKRGEREACEETRGRDDNRGNQRKGGLGEKKRKGSVRGEGRMGNKATQ